MQIRLKSNFTDYYDHWFAGRNTPEEEIGAIYSRHSDHDELSRLDQFRAMQMAGLSVVTYAPVNLYNQDFPDQQIVVYTDPHAHRGEGKLLTTVAETPSEYSMSLASKFIPTTENPLEKSISYRLLYIGDTPYHFKYTSRNWRSNWGEVDIEMLPEGHFFFRRTSLCRSGLVHGAPIIAIDYVEDYNSPGNFYCLDLNTAPGIGGTGLERILSGKQVFQIIERYLDAIGEVTF